METYSRKEDKCRQLLDLIPKQGEWQVKRGGRSHGSSEEKKLELRLGPPGEDWTNNIKDGHPYKPTERDDSLLSLRYYCPANTCGVKRGAVDTVELRSAEDGWINPSRKFSSSSSCSSETPGEVVAIASPSTWPTSGYQAQPQQSNGKPPFLQLQAMPQGFPAMDKESVLASCTKLAELQASEKKAFSPVPANTAVPNSSQKRSATTPVVGWPPIRSFRKNLASGSSSKSLQETPKVVNSNKVTTEKPNEGCRKDKFVKINMDGVPIGRKVDLQYYDSYEKLSFAVDELFRGLLAVQCDPSANGGIQQEGEKAITGLLDGSGEYTLVYEDNEGDRMLVGDDVPWHMFVSTVKRLRVLKSSELQKLCLAGNKQERVPGDAAAVK